MDSFHPDMRVLYKRRTPWYNAILAAAKLLLQGVGLGVGFVVGERLLTLFWSIL